MSERDIQRDRMYVGWTLDIGLTNEFSGVKVSIEKYIAVKFGIIYSHLVYLYKIASDEIPIVNIPYAECRDGLWAFCMPPTRKMGKIFIQIIVYIIRAFFFFSKRFFTKCVESVACLPFVFGEKADVYGKNWWQGRGPLNNPMSTSIEHCCKLLILQIILIAPKCNEWIKRFS